MIERIPKIWHSQAHMLSRLSKPPYQSLRSPIRLHLAIPSTIRPRRLYANYTPKAYEQAAAIQPDCPAQPQPIGSNAAVTPFPTYFQDPPPKPKRSRFLQVIGLSFFVIGVVLGLAVRQTFFSPLPTPHSKDDMEKCRWIRGQAESLPVVQSLNNNPEWRSWDAYSNLSSNGKARRLTSGALDGARGLGGYQRVWYNESSKEFVSVVWIGGGLAGWLGLTHGGLVATLMDESMARAAVNCFEVKTGVTASLMINYLRPLWTTNFVIIRCSPVEEGATDRKRFVQGSLLGLDGKIHALAEGLFVLPKTFTNTPLVMLDSKPNIGF